MSKASSVSVKGLELIKSYESFAPNAYKCPAGVWTIGYGHTQDVEEGDTVDETTALDLLAKDLEPVEQLLNSSGLVLNQGEYDALASLIFNIGVGAFSKSTLLGQLKKNLYWARETEIAWKAWNKADGKELPGLVKRRDEEWKMFLASGTDRAAAQEWLVICPAEDWRGAINVDKVAFDKFKELASKLKLKHTVKANKLYIDLNGDSNTKKPPANQAQHVVNPRPFDFHIVANLRQRKAKLYNAEGKLLKSVPCRGEGQEGSFKWTGQPSWRGWAQDTPPGVWDVGVIETITTRTAADVPYGRMFVWLEPRSGGCAEVSRPGIGMHGGGSGLANPFGDYQGWVITHGCIRFQNKDLEDLMRLCKNGSRYGKIRLTTSW